MSVCSTLPGELVEHTAAPPDLDGLRHL